MRYFDIIPIHPDSVIDEMARMMVMAPSWDEPFMWRGKYGILKSVVNLQKWYIDHAKNLLNLRKKV